MTRERVPLTSDGGTTRTMAQIEIYTKGFCLPASENISSSNHNGYFYALVFQ